MTYPYIIFVNGRPYKAISTKSTAITKAKQLVNIYSRIEVVYMPEDDIGTNEVVYKYQKEVHNVKNLCME